MWTTESPPQYKKSNALGQTMNQLLGHRFPDIQTNTAQFFSLYSYLLQNKNTPISNLAKQITQNGNPIFTEEELLEILRILRSQQNTRIGQYLGSMNGGQSSKPGATPVAKNAKQPDALDQDPSRSKFWDKFIRKITNPIRSAIPPSWDGVLWYFFILYNLEQMEVVGPMIGSALDMLTLSLPVAADLAEELVGKFMALAPVPYASFAGEAVGYAVSLIFLAFAFVLNTSRKHYGSGFKVSLEGVPVIGDILAEGAQSVETGADRFLTSRKKILTSVDKISPSAEDVLDYYIPDVEVKNGPAPSVNIPTMKAEVIEYAIDESGVGDVLEGVNALASGNVTQLAQNKAKGAIQNAVQGAKNKANGAVQNAVQGAKNKGTGAKGGGRKTRKYRR